MPRATVDTEATRYELKTLPGGFVELRPLPFGKVLERREKASRMSMEQQQRKGSSQKINFDLMQRWARSFDFANCIVDHNLEGDDGQKLNFSLPNTLEILDPKIGSEIEKYIDELNQDEDEDDLEAFLSASTRNSEEGKQTESSVPN